jgi:hypothetical protein
MQNNTLVEMIKRLIVLTSLLILITGHRLSAQAGLENRNTFYDAESWVLFEDFKEALPEYLQLLKSYPSNFNLKYRIGQCYLNTSGEKDKAIAYLEDAVKHINPDYKEGKFKEKGAPYDAYYYLANAYRINNQLDKAIETYNTFKKGLDPKVYDTAVVSLQIQSCYNAKDLMSMPLFIREKNLGVNINEGTADFNPVVSDDEKIMVFSRSEAFYDAILYSIKNSDGTWSAPINMNEIFKVDKDLYPTSISSDGKTLYLYSSADYDGIIYSSTFNNGTWGPLVKLNENINTKYWESHATISHDNKKLYFTSNRKGGFKGLDIYVAQRDSTGDWGTAENLGPTINTPYNEDTPFLSKDDKTLFFSSRGHLNMGGYDIFYSTLLDNGQWSVPLNVGYPLNTTDDDVFFDPINAGYQGYIAKYESTGLGKQDIYKIEIFSDQHPRKFIVRGMVKVADLLSDFEDSVRISAMNFKNPNQTIVVYSNPKTGEYEFEIPQGNYELTFESPNSEKVRKNLNLEPKNPSDSFILPGMILPKTDFVADLKVNKSANITVSDGDSILFPLKTEPESILTIEHWVGDSLVSSETYKISDSRFNYKMVPGKGDNKVSFKLTDKFNNTTSTDVFINRKKGVISQPVIRPEYTRIIAQKQALAFAEMMKNRADNNLKAVISGADIKNQKFGKVDDLVSYIKDEAAKSSISAEDVDKTALKVAVMDNVLTQAAVNLLARNTEGELKELLDKTDIYKENLKTWIDLQEYIAAKSSNRISPSDLNAAASDILTVADPGINLIREKILAYSEITDNPSAIKQSVSSADAMKIKEAGKWLNAFAGEALKNNISDSQLSSLLSAISARKGTKADVYAKALASSSDKSLAGWITSFNLKKEKLNNPDDLILYILRNKENGKVTDEEIYSALAGLIKSANITPDEIRTKAEAQKTDLWYLWIVGGAAVLFLLIILMRRRRNSVKKE